MANTDTTFDAQAVTSSGSQTNQQTPSDLPDGLRYDNGRYVPNFNVQSGGYTSADQRNSFNMANTVPFNPTGIESNNNTPNTQQPGLQDIVSLLGIDPSQLRQGNIPQSMVDAVNTASQVNNPQDIASAADLGRQAAAAAGASDPYTYINQALQLIQQDRSTFYQLYNAINQQQSGTNAGMAGQGFPVQPAQTFFPSSPQGASTPSLDLSDAEQRIASTLGFSIQDLSDPGHRQIFDAASGLVIRAGNLDDGIAALSAVSNLADQLVATDGRDIGLTRLNALNLALQLAEVGVDNAIAGTLPAGGYAPDQGAAYGMPPVTMQQSNDGAAFFQGQTPGFQVNQAFAAPQQQNTGLAFAAA